MIPGCGLANGTTWVSWTGIPIFPCSSFSCDVQKQLAFKTKIGESKSKSRKFLHSKSKTRLACWNVRSPGVLNAQGLKLQHVIQTMIEKKNTDFLALSESHWQGHGITNIQSCTTVSFIRAQTPLTTMELLLPCRLAHVLPGTQQEECSSLLVIESCTYV